MGAWGGAALIGDELLESSTAMNSDVRIIRMVRDSARTLLSHSQDEQIIACLFKMIRQDIGVSGHLNLGIIDMEQACVAWKSVAPLSVLTMLPEAPIAIDELHEEALGSGSWTGRILPDGRYKMVMPLISGSEYIALLEVITDRYHDLGGLQLQALEILCDQAATALRNAKRLQNAESVTEHFKSLQRVTAQINSKRSPERILAMVIDFAKEMPQAEKVVGWLMTPSSKLHRDSMIVRGCRRSLPEKAWRADLTKLAREIIKTKKLIILRHYEMKLSGVDIPAKNACVLGVPMMSQKKVTGILVAITTRPRHFTKADVSSLSILGRTAGRAIQNAILFHRSKRLAAYEERYRISMDLHDGLAQALFSIALNLEVCHQKIDDDPHGVKERILGLQKLSRETLVEARGYIEELQPNKALAGSLPSMLRAYVRKFNKNNGTDVKLTCRGLSNVPLPFPFKQDIYMVLQEALANFNKHAQTETAQVRLTKKNDTIVLSIEDQGAGFSMDEAENDQNSTQSQMGLKNMKKRAERLGGQLHIESSTGQGAKVTARVPMPAKGDPLDD